MITMHKGERHVVQILRDRPAYDWKQIKDAATKVATKHKTGYFFNTFPCDECMAANVRFGDYNARRGLAKMLKELGYDVRTKTATSTMDAYSF